MQKKFLSMVTALVMLMSLLPQGIITVSAATITAAQPSTDENGVYQIGTAAELYWFAAQVNGGTTDINAVLTDNIVVNTGVLTDEGYINSSNMDNFTSWTSIGNSSKQYTGTFNGNGKTISGLYFNNTSTSDTNAYYVGLFGYVGSGGRVSNVGVVGSYFEGADYIGGVCGVNYGTIESCYNAGFLSISNTNAYIGGVCGANYGTIKNCYNIGAVLLVGMCGYNDGTIENCYNAGTVMNFLGRSYGVCRDNRSTIKNCYYLDTTGTDSYATPKTAEEFASGEVAYLLQSGQEADENGNIPEVWGQDLSTANTYPVPGGAKVYQVVAYAGCENNPGNEGTAYSNTDAPVYGDHSYDSNGFGVCGDSLYQPAKWDETNNRYEISNAGQLYWFAGLVNGTLEGVTQNLSANAILTENIVVNTGVLKADGTLLGDTSGFTSWTPIGNSAYNYTGTFDGNGNTISGLYFNDINAYNVGLFGYVGSGGRVSNVGVVDSYFGGEVRVGGVCGANEGTITDCYNTGLVDGNEKVGGVCGANYGTTTDCYNIGAVSGKNLVGGVCGANEGTITLCCNKGTVMGENRIGGVCGHNFANTTIANCYNEGGVTVTSNSAHAGGVCGANEGTIANCYNTAEVGGNVNVGGVCGENYGAITDCYNTGLVDGNVNVGGVCGANEGTTTDCYNTGLVDGNDSVGGVCGVNYATTTDCYNIGAVSGKNLVGGVCGENGGTIAVCCNKGTVMGENRVGGVCGQNFANTTIANCYNAGGVTVTGDSAYAGGLCGFTADQSTITNCYNAGSITVTGDSAYVGGLCGYNFVGNIINCYFDSEKYSGNAVAQNEDGTVTNVEGKTTGEFASGEVAYILQSGQEADENGNIPEVWGQEIGTDNYPVSGGAKVYQVVAYAGCKNNPGNESTVYSNTDAPVYGDHSFDSNGFCEYGDSGYQPAEWDETNNRYEISNAGQLYWFAQQVNGGTTDINAVLTANIDLSGTGNLTPIGNAANKYRGAFDGQNHTVKDMSITKQGNNSGLFGYTEGATIKNIIITGEITITAESYTEGYGSIVGRADNNTTVTNCHSSVNITIDSTMKSTAGNCIGHIGGIIGKMHDADSPISNCSYSGTIELKDKPINVAAGIVGYAIYSSVPITNCSFTGKINSTNTGATIIGGIFGYTRSRGDVKVTNCLSVGTITKSGDTSVTGILIGQINTGYGNNAVKNNYCISSSLNVIGSTTGAPTTASATLCTETQLTSGEVAYLLNGSTSEGTLVWGQDLSTADSYPVITSDLAKKVLKVEFKTLGTDGEYTLYTEKYGNYGKVLSDFPEELTDTIWVDGVNQFTASSRVTEDKTVYPVGYSVKYDDDGKVVISAPKTGNYTIIIASYSGESLLKVQSADIQINNWYESYEITALYGFDITGADTVKVFFWDTEMRPQCDAATNKIV